MATRRNRSIVDTTLDNPILNKPVADWGDLDSMEAPEPGELPEGQGARTWPDRPVLSAPAPKAPEGQVSIKGPVEIIERFKALCKDDRRVYYDMLEILMNHYERR